MTDQPIPRAPGPPEGTSFGYKAGWRDAVGASTPEPPAPDDLQREIRVAINDPSRYVSRRQVINTQETLAEWQARAVMDVLRREGLVQ